MPTLEKERVDPIAHIKNILDNYPSGSATLRELLQNSDDSGARKQQFILDTRCFPVEKIQDPILESCQGPALIAVNDSDFEEQDWDAIKAINNSSKTADVESTGKYGLGFRSCYHITDNPHILSGSKLMILDPHARVAAFPGGFSLLTDGSDDSTESMPEREKYSDHFATFAAILDPQDETFEGTAIRLPLRLQKFAFTSRIKPMATTIETVDLMFKDFIEKEASSVLLFLHTVREIVFSKISEDGTEIQLCKIWIQTDSKNDTRNRGSSGPERVRVSLETPEESRDQEWILMHHDPDMNSTQQELAHRLARPVEAIAGTFLTEKLLPRIVLAFPLIGSHWNKGRLFTSLPLPIYTGFPLHINAVLALTSSRQHLRNASDVVPQSREELLVEWNKIIFSSLIPKAWALLLEHLVTLIPGFDVFSAWPVASNPSTEGDGAYWTALPGHILKITATKEIWPSNQANSAPIFRKLTDSLLTELGDIALVRALTACNVPIVIAPSHLSQLLRVDGQFTYNLVRPESVRLHLRSNTTALKELDDISASLLLDYLAGAGDIHLLVGLPLIPTTTGERTSLNVNQDYILASSKEGKIFRKTNSDRLSAEAIMLNAEAISTGVIAVLQRSPKIHQLRPDDVLQYLRSMYLRFRTSAALIVPNIPANDISRLVDVWHWMDSWPNTGNLLNLTHFVTLPLIPIRLASKRFGLRRIEMLAIDTSSMTEESLAALELIGAPLLHTGVNVQSAALRTLLRSPADIPYLLDAVAHRFTPSALNSLLRRELADVIVRGLMSDRIILNDAQKRTLCSLPIFPVLKPGLRDENPASLDVVSGHVNFLDESVQLVPNIATETFVDAGNATVLMRALGSSSRLGEIDILERVIREAWPSQREICNLEDAFIQRMLRRINDLSFEARQKIRNLPIIDVGGLQKKAPVDVVDPSSEIAALYGDEDHVLPKGAFAHNIPGSLLQQLQAHKMMQSKPTTQNLDERLRKFADSSTYKREEKAINLLNVIDRTLNFSPISDVAQVIRSLYWLPTPDGARLSSGCWDLLPKDAPLLDLVLPRVQVTITSTELRRVLGWDTVPTPIIVKQLGVIFSVGMPNQPFTLEERIAKVVPILQELGRRQATGGLNDDEIQCLAEVLSGQAWVPVSNSLSVEAHQAILDQVDLGRHFHRVHPELLNSEGVHALLDRLDIVAVPSTETLCSALYTISAELETIPSDLADIAMAESLTILLAIQRNSPNVDAIRSELLFPTSAQTLVPLNCVVYNDNNSEDSNLLQEQKLAHGTISLAMATFFGIPRASEEIFERHHNGIQPFDIGEDFCERINGVLKDYDSSYASNEWVANAADAGAKEVSFLQDEMEFFGERVVSPLLFEFNRGPALLVHNDGIFSDDDFSRLKRVGEGGKTGSNSIGRFGLGALSYFHFTEMLILVSANQIVFSNPSQESLPPYKGERRRGICLTLKDCRTLYPDHLKPFEGLFGFDESTEDYKGASASDARDFSVLMMITTSQANKSKLSNVSYNDAAKIATFIRGCYQTSSQSLLFTTLDRISAQRRAASGPVTPLWSVLGVRNPAGTDKPLMLHLRLNPPETHQSEEEEWLVRRATSSPQEFPEHARQVFSGRKYRISSTSLGIALRLTPPLDALTIHRVFATLPLPITTELPVHVHASWVLSSDRRSVWLDAADVEGRPRDTTVYNECIMSKLLPPLYFSLLAQLASIKPRNADHYWPPTAVGPDPIGHKISKSFYSQLVITPFPLFRTVLGRLISPGQALIHKVQSAAVRRLLEHLPVPHYVPKLPFEASVLSEVEWAGKFDDPRTVADIILQRQADVWRLLNNLAPDMLTMDDVNSLIQVMSNAKISLIGLPFLQLRSGSFTEFEDSSAKAVFASHQQQLGDLFGDTRVTGPGITDANIQIATAQDLNVKYLDSAGLRELLQSSLLAIVPGSRLALQPNDVVWLRRLLDFLATIDNHIPFEALADLPIIPTEDGLQAFSLNSIRHDSELIWWRSANNADGSVIRILTELEVPIIDLTAFSSVDPHHNFDLKAVLRRMVAHLDSIALYTSSPSWVALVTWMLPELTHTALQDLNERGDLITTLCDLPIFEVLATQCKRRYRSANEISMLPLSAPIQLVEFMPNPYSYCAWSYPLHNILSNFREEAILTPSSIVDRLRFPRRIRVTQDIALTSVLDFLCNNITATMQGVLIPDGNRAMRDPSELFDHRVRTFAHALQNRPQYFVHTSYRHLTQRFLQIGLLSALNRHSLLTCAQVIDQDTRQGQNTLDRSRDFWETFGESSSVHNLAYELIQDLRFVPVRRDARHLLLPEFQQFAANLPSVVSPREVCLEGESPVLWTQRAMLMGSPTTLITAIYPELGLATAIEVVQHLRVLAFDVAPMYNRNRELLSHLQRAYSWLAQHGEEARTPLTHNLSERLWLNVDDPFNQAWEWKGAAELTFGLEYNVEPYFDAKRFLIPYQELLVAIGAREIRHAKVREIPADGSLSHSDRTLLEGNQMRLRGKLVDVTFARHGDPPEAERIKAHRVLLAAAIPYFEDAFGNSFQESEMDTYLLAPDMSMFAVRSVVDWVYTGRFEASSPPTNAQEAEGILADLLNLLEVTDMWDIPQLKLQVERSIVERRLIRPGTCVGILGRAHDHHASYLVQACLEWQGLNDWV